MNHHKTIAVHFTCLLALILALLPGCNTPANQTNNHFRKDAASVVVNKDSVELTGLVRQVYKWHMSRPLNDFPYQYEKPADTIIIGIDWAAYHQNIQVLKETNYFTDDFFKAHQMIASTLDASIKNADIKWRNSNDGIPLWDTDVDDWCGCQDYPDNYWDYLTLDSLQIQDDYANFNWTWVQAPYGDSSQYKMTARKIKGQWKINSMEGFKYYGTVESYDKRMKD